MNAALSLPIAPSRQHWLIRAAEKAGLAGAESSRTPHGVSMADAWDIVGRSTGLSVRDLVSAVAPGLRLQVAELEKANPAALRLVPERLARKHAAFPVDEDDRTITVAIANPYDFSAEQEIAFAAGRRVRFVLCAPHLIEEAIAAWYSPDRAIEALLGSAITAEASNDLKLMGDGSATVPADFATGPVVQLTNHVLCTAVRQRASDIHIEPGPRSATIRFRVDGVMRHHMHAPLAVINRVVSRIKVMSRLDITDRLRPHDGRARIEVDGIPVDLRVSTVPTRDAEKAVIRLLRTDSVQSLDTMGAAASQLQRIRSLIKQRDGIVIVTGPTGSGKTTTLYAALREIAAGDVNVMTVEDPVEYEVAGITQMQVETKRGMTFATALRSILRQDPDVIFVGEIRDLETAVVAVQAAMTGHLVLATLHANDAMGSIARLLDIGLDRPSIAATFRGAIAQRLVRRVCPDCAFIIDGTLTPEESRLADQFRVRPVVRAIGCARCNNTGYRGRIPIHEIATSSADMLALITATGTATELQRSAAAGGMRTLLEVGIESMSAGLTTLSEIERVLGESDQGDIPEVVVEAPIIQSAVRTVLVVDDDGVQRAFCEAILRKSGYDVVTAVDGVEGLEMLAAHPETDLILTDLHMPRLDGAGFVERVRQQVETAGIPIIVLTGSSSDGDDEIRMMDLGADDYLRKPVESARLVTRVRAVLRRSGVAEPSRGA